MTDYINNPQQLFDIEGKVAIITGATGAFGSIACKVLGNAGAKLVLAGGNNKALEGLAAEIHARGGEAVCVNRRPNNPEDCEAIVNCAVEVFGQLNILIVASGMNDVDPIEKMAYQRWLRVMEANVSGSWLMCQAAGKQLIKQGTGGKVVLVSSARGKLGHPAGYAAYCPSKSAVDGLTKALGCEWGKYNITVNAIAPTVFRSDLTAWMFANDERGKSTRDGMLARIPLGRLGEPEDLAGPLLFLVSPASSFHTGHVVYADGGYTAG